MGKRIEKVKTGADKTVEYAGKITTVVTAITTVASVIKTVADAMTKTKNPK